MAARSIAVICAGQTVIHGFLRSVPDDAVAALPAALLDGDLLNDLLRGRSDPWQSTDGGLFGLVRDTAIEHCEEHRLSEERNAQLPGARRWPTGSPRPWD